MTRAFEFVIRMTPGVGISLALAAMSWLLEPLLGRLITTLTGRPIIIPAVVIVLFLGMAFHPIPHYPAGGDVFGQEIASDRDCLSWPKNCSRGHYRARPDDSLDRDPVDGRDNRFRLYLCTVFRTRCGLRCHCWRGNSGLRGVRSACYFDRRAELSEAGF